MLWGEGQTFIQRKPNTWEWWRSSVSKETTVNYPRYKPCIFSWCVMETNNLGFRRTHSIFWFSQDACLISSWKVLCLCVLVKICICRKDEMYFRELYEKERVSTSQIVLSSASGTPCCCASKEMARLFLLASSSGRKMLPPEVGKALFYMLSCSLS